MRRDDPRDDLDLTAYKERRAWPHMTGAWRGRNAGAKRLDTARAQCRQLGLAQQPHGGLYSMTSSARARIAGGTVRPSTCAVLRLKISSIFVDWTTGSSAGFSPFRTLPV